MQNAWSALRGAVNEINAVLLSEDEEDDEEQGEEGSRRQKRELELLVKQQQAQQEALARQLEQSEAETAKYAQQLASLRRECRQLRSQVTGRHHQQQQQQQQQQANGYSGEGEAGEAARAGAAASASKGSSGSGSLAETLGQPLERLTHALRVPVRRTGHAANQRPREEDEDPCDVYEGICSSLERATSHAEFLLKEWEQTRASASFQELISHPLARSLPGDLVSWLRHLEPTEEPSSGTSTPGTGPGGTRSPHGEPVPLISCVKLAARLVRCAGALAVAGIGEGSADPWGPPSGSRTQESSVTNTPRPMEEGENGNENIQLGIGASETERKWREEAAKRQQLQHKAAALQRRVLELTEDLKDSKQMIEEQREAERERAKHAESEEAERLRHQLNITREQLETVRKLYETLLEQYEKRHAGAETQTSEELAGENRDLLLQLRSWQCSHAGVSHSLQEALSELAELRANAARAQALEKEIETVKREAGRLEEIREIQNISEVELIKAHAERDAMETELQETKAAVEKYARVLKRVQVDCDATISRLRSDLFTAQKEAEVMRDDLALTSALKAKVQELESCLAEAQKQREEAAETAEKLKENNHTLSEGMEKLLQRLHAQVEEQDYFVDKRIVAQMIAKHQQLEGQIKRRDEVFALICDVLGFDEEDRRRLGLRGKQTDKGKASGLSEQFVEFLNDEVK